MSNVVHVSPVLLPEMLVGEDVQVRLMIKAAIKASCLRLKAHLIKKTDEMGITDLGTYKGSFRATKNSVTNAAPHAPIVEEGCRPHKVSEEGVRAIAEWVKRKLTIRSGPVQRVEKTINSRRGPGSTWGEKKEGPVRRTQKKVSRVVNEPGSYDMQDEEAMSIAQLIAWKIQARGMKGRYVMRDSLADALKFFVQEINRQFRKSDRLNYLLTEGGDE